jgi:hypothetical protein
VRTIIVLAVALAAFGTAPALCQDHHGHEGHQHHADNTDNAASDDQEGYVGAGHAKWHDTFYKKLLRPDTKTSCCNMTDCRPTAGRITQGHYEVKVNGAWISVPQDKILQTAAPDGGYHVCAPLNFKGAPGELYCVVVAPEG